MLRRNILSKFQRSIPCCRLLRWGHLNQWELEDKKEFMTIKRNLESEQSPNKQDEYLR